MENETKYNLVMPFLDGSSSYACGFQDGILWHRCRLGDFPDHETVHSESLEQIKLIAEKYNCDLFVDDTTDDTWSVATMVQKPGLRIVK